MGGKMRLRTETSKNPSFRVSGSRVTDNPETWINPAKPEDIFGNVLMSSLVHLLVRNAQDVQYLHHHLHDDVRHRGTWSNLVWVSRRLKKFSMLKDVDKSILRCADVLSYLTTSRGKLRL